MTRVFTAIGLMSGTSLDGVDAALIRTDGVRFVEAGPWVSCAYEPTMREALRRLLGRDQPDSHSREIEQNFTNAHVAATYRLIQENLLTILNIDIIGFHGHTITHRPEHGLTWQIGDAALLANTVRRDVVGDFRSADVAAGGQGAPFAPLYHQALSHSMKKPLAVLNLGGVGNVTWIGEDGLLAFDTGPGNALLDDWVSRHGRGDYDPGGAIAASGQANPRVLSQLLAAPYFQRRPPKSLDRLDFDLTALGGLSLEDGAATLAGLTVGAVIAARDHLPEAPRQWLVTGGGRHNDYLMALLAAGLDAPVAPVEDVGWQGDALEAQAFAYLAVRSILGLPLSLPTTTGVGVPRTGGVRFRPRS